MQLLPAPLHMLLQAAFLRVLALGDGRQVLMQPLLAAVLGMRHWLDQMGTFGAQLVQQLLPDLMLLLQPHVPKQFAVRVLPVPMTKQPVLRVSDLDARVGN